MLAFPCSGCGANLTASDEMAGFPIRCPKCQATTRVPEVALVSPSPTEARAPAPPPAPSAGEFRPCPFCGESIRVSAKKCRFCNTFLSGDMPAGGEQAGWDGDHLFIPVGGFIPPSHCGICGVAEGVEGVSKNFYHVPRFAYVGFVLGPLPGAILTLVLRKRQTLAFPLCRPCRSQWTLATALIWVFVLVGLVGLPALCAFVGSLIDKRDGVGFGMAAGFVIWIAAIILFNYLYVRRRQATCVFIDRVGTSLRLPRPDALRAAWQTAEM